jgi:hypothetical protein
MEPDAAVPQAAEEPEERTAWYAPGLYRRVAARRRTRAEQPRRLSLRERMRARGLHWSTEVVVGVFVAVLVASLATVAVLRVGAGGAASLGIPSHEAGNAGAVNSRPTPTPPCIAAPIPGSAMRACTH